MRHIYRDLALNSLSKNKAIYIPYIIAIITMYVITYSIAALASDRYIRENLMGGSNLQMIMTMGIFIMFNVAVLFLFSINRFVDKKRKKELGIYGILGLEKRHIRRVASIENGIVYSVSVVTGTVISIVISKLLQLIIIKSLSENVDFDWSVNIFATLITVIMFLIIFVVTQVDSTISIQRTNLLDYMKEESKGEKQPKSKWFTAILGLILLAAGYIMSFTSSSAGAALNFFFFAVALVIFGTLFLFQAGTITLLNALKKNKDYYYQTKHFISISGILFRMKRNASDLATICVFSTMFLVTMSAAISLYVTMNKTVDSWYLKDFFFVYSCSSEIEDPNSYVGGTAAESDVIATAMAEIKEYSDEANLTFDDLTYYHEYNSFSEITIDDNARTLNCTSSDTYNFNLFDAFYITADCYKKANGVDLGLKADEIGVYSDSIDLIKNAGFNVTFGSDSESVYKFTKVDNMPEIYLGSAITISNGTVYFIFPDEESVIKALRASDDHSVAVYNDLIFAGTTSSSKSSQVMLADNFDEGLNYDKEDKTIGYCIGKYATAKEIIGLYSGIYFVGIFLSLAFITVTVLNLYFKQLFEGYEDASGFAIMRKVGLTKKEIKKSINSQVLLMFFLPLVVAIIHTFAAFPMVSKLLKPFGTISPIKYFGILMIVVLIFSVIYSIAYLCTGRVYSKLVNGAYSSRKVF